MGRKARILVVDDEEIVRMRICRVLTSEGYHVTQVRGGNDALDKLKKKEYDLVLSDMVMEDMDGLELLKKVSAEYPETIFMIITGQGSLVNAIESMRLGTFDYLLKPCDDSELKMRVERGLKERRLLKKVKEQKIKLEQMAITDGLTGLYSRSYFMEALDREFKQFTRYRSPLSFMMIDIDYFKQVNDEFGHLVGDEVLRDMSDKFLKIIREADIIGRYGGEEFGVIQPKTDKQGAYITATRIQTALEKEKSRRKSGKTPLPKPTVSIGIASCPHRDIKTPARLIKAADTALYEAKRTGRNRIVIYDAEGFRLETEQESAQS
ncbi:MAG: diguanylate cyclase [Planctomycetota bacterium]